MDAYEVLMACPQRASTTTPGDPWVTGVLYCARLEHVDSSEPLWRISYYGQAVRVGTPEEVANARWKEEVHKASKESKQIGFLAALGMFGEDAFEWSIVESREGLRSEMQAYADAGEVRLIAEAGGPLQSMTQRLRQTFNQTEGGKGANWWASIDAFRANCFDRFRREMEAYVEEEKTSLVPRAYVNPLTKSPLGRRLSCFRQGHLWKGSPRQTEIVEWAEALPKWAWDARETEEYREGCSKRGHEKWANKSEEDKSKWKANQKAAQNTPEFLEGCSKRGHEKWANKSEEDKSKWKANKKAAQNTPAYLDGLSKRKRDEWANQSEEKRAERLAKLSTTNRAKREAKLALMTPKERKVAEKKIATQTRSYAKRTAELRLLRTVMPNAKKSDISAARRNGTLAKAQAAARAAASSGAGSSSDPLDVAPMSDSDSDSE